MRHKGLQLVVWTAAFLALGCSGFGQGLDSGSNARSETAQDRLQANAILSNAVISRSFAMHGPPPAIIPSSATVTIRARGTDGSIPVGSYCDVMHSFPLMAQGFSSTPGVAPPPSPTIVGSNGDWVAYNVTPAANGWGVRIEDT